jgi:hypothetical protein
MRKWLCVAHFEHPLQKAESEKALALGKKDGG